MKFDELGVETLVGHEHNVYTKSVKKKRKIKLLDVVIMQLVLCVMVSSVVLTARVVSRVEQVSNDEANHIEFIVEDTTNVY